jgi:hypothetical protein
VNSISGGTVWHWRAWQRDAQWQATREAIHRYHQANGPKEGELLLLGCSAGWMLNTSWLKGFTKLTAVDLDPLAGWLFSLRHRGLKHLQWHQADALEQLDALLLAHPKASILFDNMLGQQTLIHLHEGRSSEKELVVLEKDLAALKDRLRGRTWGSLHDRISGPVRISADRYKKYFAKPLVTESQNRQTNAQLMQTLGAFDEVIAYGEWLDHLTSRVFSLDAPRTYVLWPFAPSYWHWLELAWVKPGDNKMST